ncbi:unnamed protein product, partial [Symbiodinium sp. KB8]
YLLVKSHRVAVGSREDFQRRTSTPSFPGPYVVTFGGVQDAAQLMLELWDHNSGGGNDEMLEQVMIDFQSEASFGTKTWPMSAGGTVTLTWVIAPEPLFSPPSSPDLLRVARVAAQDLNLLVEEGVALEPYILMTGVALEVQQRWQPAAGSDPNNPVWEDVRELLLDVQGYTVEVWRTSAEGGDQLLSDVLFLPDVGATQVTLELPGLRGTSRLQLGYSVQVNSPGVSRPVVMRKEIRLMPQAEQGRFVAAVKKLMENKDGPQTSEWFRLASYHGWPEDYCEHGQETFPGWHRAYLCEAEQALIKADKELGNDGRIGIPYWDWSRLEINGEVMPKIIRDNFSELPPGLVNPSEAGRLGREGFSSISSEERLRQQLTSMQVARGAERCLTENEHWLHASTRGRGFSVEDPHNSVHVACGFPMTTVPYAAFHPIFFLHHSNCDRIYEKHVQLETPEECAAEFALRQQGLAQQGEVNRFLLPLAPFMHPFDAERQMVPSDTFDTKALGYEYDELPPEPPQRMTEEPVYVAFRDIQVLQMDRKSYALHIFLTAKGAAWVAPERLKEYSAKPGYAGAGAIFGGRAQECQNCRSRPPFTVLVEVQKTLQEMRMSRHDAEIHVMCEDELGTVLPLEETPVPRPVFMGPWFEDVDSLLRSGASGVEVLQLQRALTRLGYLAEDPNYSSGVFDETTEEAVKEFQRFSGLTQDGIAGPVTKAQLTAQRFDKMPDVNLGGSPFKDGKLTYAVGLLPGYLERYRADCLREMHEALAQWCTALGMELQRTSHLQARLHIVFQPLAMAGAAPRALSM